MKHRNETEVLVVGAGPVGMMTALLLTEAGIDVQLIDKARGPVTRSCACGLHPHSLSLLRQVGMTDPVREAGHRIDTIALYDGAIRRAEIHLSDLPVEFPFAMALHQGALERLLEQKLQTGGKCKVLWNHRLSKLKSTGRNAVAAIEKMGITAQGYPIAAEEWVVESEWETTASFVVGADGHDSFVRNSAGIECDSLGEAALFTLCDFESDGRFGNEARIVLDGGGIAMLWPLSGRMARWSVQTSRAEHAAEFPAKDSKPVIVRESSESKAQFQRRLERRAPWFTQTVKEIDWHVEAPFEMRLANRFGEGRCWLAGDAAHQSSPLGMHSMNVGLAEAVELANALKQILREGASRDLLERYDNNWRTEWRDLFTIHQAITPGVHADPWVKERWGGILPCLPASRRELALLAHQPGFELAKLAA